MPGAAYKPVVTVSFTVAATVETFDVAAFRTAMLALFTDAEDAFIVVAPASVSATARLIFPASAAASAAVTQIQSTSASSFSNSLGVDVTAASAPQLATEQVVAPPPPSPMAALSPSPPVTTTLSPPSPPLSVGEDGSGGSMGMIAGAAGGGGAVLLLLLCIFWRRKRAERKSPPPPLAQSLPHSSLPPQAKQAERRAEKRAERQADKRPAGGQTVPAVDLHTLVSEHFEDSEDLYSSRLQPQPRGASTDRHTDDSIDLDYLYDLDPDARRPAPPAQPQGSASTFPTQKSHAPVGRSSNARRLGSQLPEVAASSELESQQVVTPRLEDDAEQLSPRNDEKTSRMSRRQDRRMGNAPSTSSAPAPGRSTYERERESFSHV